MTDDQHPTRVLIVEDDTRLAALIQEYLQQQGFEVATEPRGDLAATRVQTYQPELVILDLMLPGRYGLDVCRELRPFYLGPILILTAREEDTEQVVGLELGADDYVTKPVQPRVLLARIRALLRRASPPAEPAPLAPSSTACDKLVFGALCLNRAAREVSLQRRVIEFTTAEFDLLWLLASHAGEILSRDTILQTLRGIDYDGLDRSVDIAISRLRRKLDDAAERPVRIKTIRSQGYLFVPDAW